MSREPNLTIDFLSVAPVLPVEDVAATVAWYESCLGFKSQAFPAEPPFAEAILWRDDVRILLAASDEPPPAPAGALFTVKGIRTLYASLCERVSIRTPLTRAADGTLSFDLEDPNGYSLTFSEEPDAA